MRFLSQTIGGGVEQPMIPSHPPNTGPGANPASKRKSPEDGDAVLRNAKKAKQESNPKRKQEKLGGLVIVRGPPKVPSSQSNSQPSSSRIIPDQSTDQASTSGPSSSSTQKTVPSTRQTKPPSATTDQTRQKGKARETPDASNVGVDQDEVDEDVRRMNSEADDIRDRTRASLANMTPAAQRVQLEIPSPSLQQMGKSRMRQLQGAKSGKSGRLGTPPSKGSSKDIVMALPDHDTPQIVKNRLMRGEPGTKRMPSTLSNSSINGASSTSDSMNGTRRRSSLGRGKRVSTSLDTGIITRPHTSVSDSSLYKHIDPELPEPQRMRQLLVWTASRSTHEAINSQSSQRRKSVSRSKTQEPPLPPLPPGGEDILRKVEEDVIRMLAEGRIDTNVFTPPGETSKRENVRENVQNVKNKAREKLFTEQIEERKQEDIAWAEVAQFYNAHQSTVLGSLNQRHRARTPTSSKSKGKQRATSQEPDELESTPWETEIPEDMRTGYEEARKLLRLGAEGVGKSERSLQDIQFREDCLHASVSACRQFADMTSSTLSQRFSLLRLARSQRADPLALPTAAPDRGALSNFVPYDTQPPSSGSSQLLPSRAPDPQDLLRTISQADASRPRSKVGDTARRAARDVQRVEAAAASAENRGGLGVPGLNQSQQYHRKLTDVPPPTPRKPPGTPRRPSTPGNGRR